MAKFIQINVLPESRAQLNKLSKKYDRRMYVIVDQMVEFFKETGFDPAEKEFDLPAAELRNLRNSLISFIRTQEKDILLPLAGNVEEMITVMARQMGGMNPAGIPNTNTNQADQGKVFETKKGNRFYLPKTGAKTSEKDSIEIRELKIRAEKAEQERDRYKKRLEKMNGLFHKKGAKHVLELDDFQFKSIMG